MPEPLPDWTVVKVHAGALNFHDVWTLKGVGPRDSTRPVILGCDGSGVDEDGNEVVIHAVIGDAQRYRDETFDPQRSILSEVYDGTFADYVAVPRRNLLPKPVGLSHGQAACLPTSWLTAFRMVFTCAELVPGDTVLIQGGTGGVATAALLMAQAAGMRVFVTCRDTALHDAIRDLGAAEVFEPSAKLPYRVDAVIDSVGGPTLDHSLKSLMAGGRLVTCGASAGGNPPANLNHVFFRQLRIIGSTMGSFAEFRRMLNFIEESRIAPLIDSIHPLHEAGRAFSRMIEAEHFGKIVLRMV